MQRGLKGLVGSVAALGSLVALGYNSFFTVETGHRAVIFNRFGGVSANIMDEGLHFMLPWFQYPQIFETRARQIRFQSTTGTRDMQSVKMSLSVIVRPNRNELHLIWQQLGTDYAERVMRSIVLETMKSVLAQFSAVQIMNQRDLVTQKILARLRERAANFHLLIDEIAVDGLSFTPEFNHAVERKKAAEVEVDRARYKVQQAKQEKLAKIARAEGEARAARKIGESVRTNAGYIRVRQLEAAQEIAAILARSPNNLYLNSDTLMLNIQQTAAFDTDLMNAQ
ncbi:MAG: hypothetical protein MHM6MM_000066 [Cercozoa sp. M6MM]